MYAEVFNEFEQLWNSAVVVDESLLEKYKKEYLANRIVKSFVPYKNTKKQIEPNKMQVRALKNLDELRKKGEEKALLISATGTGKTFLAAFDVNQANAKIIDFFTEGIHK